MKKKYVMVVSLVLVTSLLTACEGMRNEDMGAITGGVLGGVLGSQVGKGSGQAVAIVGGTLVGAYLGSRVGRSMDDVDRMKVNNALEHNRINKTTSWSNPDSGAHYAVTPTKTYYRQAQGTTQPCREYTTTATINGKRETVYGRACRMADGSWQVVS